MPITVNALLAARVNTVLNAAAEITPAHSLLGASLAADLIDALNRDDLDAVMALRTQAKELNARIWDAEKMDCPATEVVSAVLGAIGIIRDGRGEDEETIMVRAIQFATAPHGVFKSFAGVE